MLASQHLVDVRSHLGTIALRTMLVIFGVLLALSYAYTLFLSLTTDEFHVMRMIMSAIVILVPFVLGWLIEKKHPGHTIAMFFLIMAYSSAVATIALAIKYLNAWLSPPNADLIETFTLVIGHIIWIPGVFFPLFLMPLYFPTGRLISPRWRALPVLFVFTMISMAVTVIFRPWPWALFDIGEVRAPNGIPGSGPFFDAAWVGISTLTLLLILLIPVNIFLRYRHSRGVERIQMRWSFFAIALSLVLSLIYWTMPGLWETDAEFGYPITWGVSMLFPISIGIAILRHHLFDIDIIINRTLVYGGLTAVTVLVYAVVVGGLGGIFHAPNSTFSGLFAAAIIAIIFQPLRMRLQRGVNRLLYGERDEPAIVLSRLAQQMETGDVGSGILPNLAKTIARALKIPHVAIWLPDAKNQLEPAVVWGKSSSEGAVTLPLTYQNETVGQLVVAPRGPRETFTREEQQLLATIAALIANTVRAVQLSDELQRSRQRIVAAREDERRRLRRDLHDGLGPQLASQTLALEAVAQHIPANPQKAQTLLRSLKSQAQEAMLDVRRLVYDLRPPALDDLGLVGALRQSAARYTSGDLSFTFDLPADLPELPAAVETAAYRIAQEAMTNVIRHAQATLCTVNLACTYTDLVIEVRDNGIGLSPAHRSGVGFQAMKERATELNGQFFLESLPDGGTLVRASLPLEVHGE